MKKAAAEKLDLGKINRSKMARDLGIDVSHVSRIFSGKAKPSLPLASRMAKYLGITMEQLWELLQIKLKGDSDDSADGTKQGGNAGRCGGKILKG